MAKMDVKISDAFLNSLEKLENATDKVIDRALEAGAEIVEAAVRGNLAAVLGKTSTGELLSSLGTSPPDTDGKGVRNVKVGFNEPRRKQYAAKGKRSYGTITNAMIANVIEYGRHGQPPKPFMSSAKSSSRQPAIAAMKEVIISEMKT
jgi:HK97 gp10 family phage protein